MRYAREREERDRGDLLGVEYEKRVTPSRVTGFGGTFAPPKYLIERFAVAPRPEKVLARLIDEQGQSLLLPSGCQSINVPRIVKPGTGEQTVSDAAANPSKDISDSLATSQVVTISGTSDVAMQLLELSGPGASHTDRVIWADLSNAWDAALESELMNGLGGTKELLGLSNVGPGEITFTSGAPTGILLFKAAAEAFGLVAGQRKLSPEVWLMRGGRWAWLASALDKNERPFVPPGDWDSDDVVGNAIGSLLGRPVCASESIPSNLGVAQNQDLIYTTRPSDMWLWIAEPHLDLFGEVLSGNLLARIQLRSYCAFIGNRYPSATATIAGTGMTVASNF
jgi:HK97 family phage major capsid protein